MKDAILYRFNHVCRMKPEDAPILFMYGAICRKEKGESLEELFRSDQASFSYGFLGIDDCVRLLLNNKTILDKEGMELGKRIIKYLSEQVEAIKKEFRIPLSLYATPFESGIHSLFQEDLKHYKEVMPEWLLQREYYTNSYHFSSELPTDAFTKISAEVELMKYANGGNIIYSEIGNVVNNEKAILELIEFGNEKNVQYQAFNVRSSTCYECGYVGEISYNEKQDKYVCPNCGNSNNTKLSIINRCCGYLSDYDERKAVYGRLKEIKNRAIHIGEEFNKSEDNINS